MRTSLWDIEKGDGPAVATAVHAGHELREEVAGLLALDEAVQLREEDPYTGEWTCMAGTRVVPRISRFEVDLNRPREEAVYERPEDAWGLQLWKSPPPAELVERSRREHDAFYAEMRAILTDIEQRHGRFVVFDLHSYNHLREGPDGPVADPEKNPEVNVGTGTMDRERWAPVVDRFIHDLRAFDFLGRRLDVRENVKFRGRNLAGFVHQNFPRSGCTLAVEFKKFFMNEWTGQPDPMHVDAIGRALKSTVWGIHEELAKLELATRNVPA